jgi:hypothetical protein
MYPLTRSNQDLYLCEEIQYPDRCSFPGCPDDIILSTNGVDRHCFKHQIDTDL